MLVLGLLGGDTREFDSAEKTQRVKFCGVGWVINLGLVLAIEKNIVLLKRISWQGFRGSSRARQQFRESDGLWLNVHE